MLKLKNVKIEHLMVGILVTYIPFHLFEEALGNFPAWMQAHHWLSNLLTYGHWMAGNIFFYFPLLLAGVFLYRLAGERFLFAGVGVLLWGILNFLEHGIYSIIDLKVSPAMFTGIVLAGIGAFGLNKLKQLNKFSFRVMAPSFLIALFYAGFPIFLQIVFSPVFKKIFI
jgi:hypothetical protein